MHRARQGLAKGLALVLVASGAAAGCGMVGGRFSGFTGSGSCGDINGGACSDQLESVGARHPGATSIDIMCTAAVCDRKGGSGTAVVTMPNGAIVKDTFSYVGDPAPLPAPVCTGIPLDVCRQQVDGAVDSVSPSKHIVAITVRCSVPSCTAAKGAADISITLGDGSTQQSNARWEGAAP